MKNLTKKNIIFRIKKIFLHKNINNINLNYYNSFFKESLNRKEFFKKKPNITIFNNSFIKNGLKLKSLNILNNSFYNFYNLFLIKQQSHIPFNKYQDFFTFSKNDSNFFKKTFLLNRIIDLLTTPFYLKIEKISKKIKKIKKYSKLKYKFKVCYMPNHRRTSYLIKQINVYINTLKYFGIETRVTEAIYNLILEDKNSVLYRQKINIIKKFKK